MSQLETPTYIADMERVVSFAEADEILRNAEFAAGGTEQESEPFRGRTLLELEGAEHRQRRRLETPLFARPMLAQYDERILGPAIDRCLAEPRAARGPDDVVRADLASITHRMFLQIAAAVIGFDDVDTPERTAALEQCMYALNAAFDVKYSTRDHAAVVAEGLAAKERFVDAFYRPAVQRRADLLARHSSGELGDDAVPRDLLTVMLRHHGDDWDADLPVREAILFMAGATDTTSNAVNHAIVDLEEWWADHPADRDLIDDPAFLYGVCNEALRLHPNVTALVRRATRDIMLSSGRSISGGTSVALDFRAVNTDPVTFGADAADFNPFRQVPPGVRPYGLAFGIGRHLCLGLPLVTPPSGRPSDDGEGDRSMVRIVRALLDAGIRLDPERPPRFSATAEDVHASLPVLLTRL